jgi:hypothetical protein
MQPRSSTRIDLWPNFWRALIAVIVGNALYFLIISPHLPPNARHRYFAFDLGLVIDFWVCLVVYGIVLSIWKKKR